MKYDFHNIGNNLAVAYEDGFREGYKQAEADILANIADGGTSCHWCIAEREKKARNEVAKEIFARIFDIDECGDLGEFCGEGWVFSVGEVKEIATEFGVEVKQ